MAVWTDGRTANPLDIYFFIPPPAQHDIYVPKGSIYTCGALLTDKSMIFALILYFNDHQIRPKHIYRFCSRRQKRRFCACHTSFHCKTSTLYFYIVLCSFRNHSNRVHSSLQGLYHLHSMNLEKQQQQ